MSFADATAGRAKSRYGSSQTADMRLALFIVCGEMYRRPKRYAEVRFPSAMFRVAANFNEKWWFLIGASGRVGRPAKPLAWMGSDLHFCQFAVQQGALSASFAGEASGLSGQMSTGVILVASTASGVL